jgi:NAD(P)-dependent dehydrogenase (short-subunit alcohol dehydrogenase family)
MWSPWRAPSAGWRSSTTVFRPRAGTQRWRPIDLTDDNAIAHLCRSIHDRWGRADIWVHAAIHVSAADARAADPGQGSRPNIATNIRMLARLIANVEPLIALAEAPQAVFFDDVWDEKFAGAYAMSKAAQRALVESWAAESAKHGPKVHLLRPNPMPTAVRARFYPGEDKAVLANPPRGGRAAAGTLFAGADFRGRRRWGVGFVRIFGKMKGIPAPRLARSPPVRRRAPRRGRPVRPARR